MAGYRAEHHWINRHHPKTGRCEDCGREGRTEYASVGHTYIRDREAWRELCARCHRKLDGHPTPEQRAKLSAALKGKPKTAAHRAAISAARRRMHRV